MGRDLTGAPPSLVNLFPEAKSLEDKAFRFLEVHYECGNKFHRTSRRLQEIHNNEIHHNTVRKIFEYLRETDVYARHQRVVVAEVESVYSQAVLVDLFKDYRSEVERADEQILKYLGTNKTQRLAATKQDRSEALKWAKHKKGLMDKMASISLALRGVYAPGNTKDDPQDVDDDNRFAEIMAEADEYSESEQLDA